MIKLNGEPLAQEKFPDGTPRISGISPLTYTIPWYFDAMDELFTVACIARHLHEKGLSTVLHLPYVPNARMDRVKETGEVFTLKYFCEFINGLHFDSVKIFDPHSSVAAALLNRVSICPVHAFIDRAAQDIAMKTGKQVFLVFPDEGAMKRYSNLDEPFVFGVKRRDWTTGQIQGLDLIGEIPKDQPALIVDDICSYGGTFVRAAEQLRACGVPEVYLYVTHCENAVANGKLLSGEFVDHIFTTNSIYRGQHSMITAFDLERYF